MKWVGEGCKGLRELPHSNMMDFLSPLFDGENMNEQAQVITVTVEEGIQSKDIPKKVI